MSSRTRVVLIVLLTVAVIGASLGHMVTRARHWHEQGWSGADGTIVRLAEGGPAFSRLFESSTYEEREIALAPGDRIVLFTGGVSEAMDVAGKLFDESRIEKLVAGAPEATAAALQAAIVDGATTFSGGDLEDDLTLVVLRITG